MNNNQDKAHGQQTEQETSPLAIVESQAAIEQAVNTILLALGEDPQREGLKRTPQRVAKMFSELLEGYQQDLDTLVNNALFDVEYGRGEMVAVKEIKFNSMCEHHMLPFSGTAHIAYIPNEKVIGLSKIPRIVDMFTRRLQVQERLTNEIADAIEQATQASGVMVLLESEHSCASLRGVEKHGMSMITTATRGEFAHHKDCRDEFYQIIGR